MIPTVAKNEKNENLVVIASHDVGQKQNKKERQKNKIFVDKIKSKAYNITHKAKKS